MITYTTKPIPKSAISAHRVGNTEQKKCRIPIYSSTPQPKCTESPRYTIKTEKKREATAPQEAIYAPNKKRRKTSLLFSSSMPKAKADTGLKHRPLLNAYQQKYLGVSTSEDVKNGTSSIENNYNATDYNATHPIGNGQSNMQSWKRLLPSRSTLYREEFGKPDTSHSFTQEACGETILHFVLKSGYLHEDDITIVHKVHPLVAHLDNMRIKLADYDFTSIRNINKDWAKQKKISKLKARQMLACLFHYDLDVSLLMRYLGNNYTASYREVDETVSILKQHKICDDLIQRYIRVMTIGCPAKMVAETSRDNVMTYFRGGNNPSIKKSLPRVMDTMNKEERNNFVIPIPSWIARFVPHLFFTPQHLLEKENKKARQIFDAKYRYNAESKSVNMFTSTAEGTELQCDFGDTLLRLLTRIWNLRITYPNKDIVLHANDVKSCFRQLKHHPDVMGAFSYIIDEYLFLQCSLTFGSDFSPANWEVVRRIAEKLAESLFDDTSLISKHRQYLDRLRWKKDLGKKSAVFSPAKEDDINHGVLNDQGEPINTPHAFYVDDDVYGEMFDVRRIEQAVAASIEAIFILLGPSCLQCRQDAVSFDKMEEMMINYLNRILGRIINTRTMMIATPKDYIYSTVCLLRSRWHNRRQTFFINELEILAGQLGHISETVPWLRFLLAQVYTSIAHGLGCAQSHLYNTRKQFRELLKMIKADNEFLKGHGLSKDKSSKDQDQPKVENDCIANKNGIEIDQTMARTRHRLSFNLSKTAKEMHHCRLAIPFNRTLRKELKLIEAALSDPSIDKQRPIAHIIPRMPSAIGHSDSCLRAAGGFSIEMGFYWYIEWPEEIQRRTLRYVRDNSNNNLISINVLEYAALIINYCAATHYYNTYHNDPSDPYPTVLLYADNTTAEAWAKMKQCKTSLIGRNLGLMQCALMLNNRVGINIAHVTTKDNVIADRISRIKKESNFIPHFDQLQQEFPQLTSCRRFHPSAELVSCIMDILLSKKQFDPLEARNKVLATLGQNTI